MNTDSGRDDATFRKILASNSDADESQIRAKLVADESLLDRYEETVETQRMLDRSGAFAREILAERDDGRPLPGDDRIDPTLRALLGKGRRPVWWIGARVAAAAAIVVTTFWVGTEFQTWRSNVNQSSTSVTLSEKGLAVEGPTGEVTSFGPFTVKVPSDIDMGGWRIVVKIFDADNPVATPRIEKTLTPGMAWSPSAADLGGLKRIRWYSEVLDDAGDSLFTHAPQEHVASLLP